MVQMRRGQAIVACCLISAGCPGDEPDQGPLLIVQPAAVQPRDVDNGIILVVQARGGNRLAIRTDHGTHVVGQSPERREASCLDLDDQGAPPLELLVLPDNREAVVFVDLRRGDDACLGRLLKRVIVPVFGGSSAMADGGPEGEPDAP